MLHKTCLVLVAIIVTALGGSICEAAHFSQTGTSTIHASVVRTLNQYQWCNFTWGRLDGATTTIDPDGAEHLGDPVTLNTCVTGSGSTSIPSERYVAIGGIGDATSFAVACLPYPNPTYTPPSKPGTLILNPGAGQTILFSYGPQVITGNQSVTPVHQCSTVQAHIGDTLQVDFGLFALLYDTQSVDPPPAGGSASINFTFDANLGTNLGTSAVAVPTLGVWGMIILVILLLGIGTFHLLMRRRAAP